MAASTFDSIWNVDPVSGTGEQTLSISAEPNTGRNRRNIVFSATGTYDTDTIESSNKLNVVQVGKHMYGKTSGGFIEVTNPTDNIPATGGTASFTGNTNLQTLKLSLPNTAITSATITIDGVTTELSSDDISALAGNSGYSPSGDPGADKEYSFSFTAQVEENATQEEKEFTGTIGYDDVTASLYFKQLSSGESSSEIWFSNGQPSEPTTTDITINLDADGNISGESTPYINTIPTGTSWVIDIENS